MTEGWSTGGAAPWARGPMRIFMGPDGLRAGWRLLLFLALMAVLSAGLFFPFRHSFGRPRGEILPAPFLLSEALQCMALLGAAALLGRIERRPLLRAGFSGRRRAARFCWGLAWGFAAISGLVFFLARLRLLTFAPGGPTLAAAQALRYGLLWGALFLMVGFFEETFFRGYMQAILAGGMGFWPAAILLSIAFGLVHRGNPGESHVGLFAAGLVAILFSISLWRTGSLWWAIGFHAAWDWGQSYFYGTPDSGLLARGHLFTEHPSGNVLLSGGPTGPEGSIYVLPLIALFCLGCWLWWSRGGAPAWPREHAPDASSAPFSGSGADATAASAPDPARLPGESA